MPSTHMPAGQPGMTMSRQAATLDPICGMSGK
jgi:hypothetical protein